MSLDGTYIGLKASVADFLARTDLTSTIPDFITMAEAHMNRYLRVRRQVALVTNLSISGEYTSLPADFLAERTLTLQTDPAYDLKFETQDTLDEIARTQSLSYTATPRWYGVMGTKLRVRPVPDQTYTANLTYFQSLPALATNGSNWLLTAYPDAYLYGALTQSAPYLQDDERLEVWGRLFKTALDTIQHAERERVGKRLKTDRALSPMHYRNGLYNIVTDQF